MTQTLPEVPSNDPTSFCRLCFSQQNIHWVIRTLGTKVDLPFVNTIGECLGLWLSLEQDFPCAVCWRCTKRLEEIVRFREVCRRCDEAIKNKRREDPSAMVLFYDYPEDKVFINGSAKPGFLPDDPDFESQPMLPEVVLDECSLQLDKRIRMSQSQKKSALKSYMESYVMWTKQISRTKDDDEMTDDAPESVEQENQPEFNVLCEKYENTIRSKSQRNPLTISSYTCCFCRKTFRSKQLLNHHKNAMHNGSKKKAKHIWKCPDCGQTFQSLTQMRMHAVRHRRSLLISCPTCGIQFLTQNELKAHLKNNGCRLKSFGKCKYCDRTFSRRGRYIFHLKKLHPGKPLPGTKTSDESKRPRPTILTDPRYPYTDIKRTTINNTTIEDRGCFVVLLTDIRVEPSSVEKSQQARSSSIGQNSSLVCTICYERFINIQSYKNHLEGCFKPDNATEQAPSPYELCNCKTCEEVFEAVDPLVKHLREHEQPLQIKPHDCVQCSSGQVPKFLLHPHSPTMILGD